MSRYKINYKSNAKINLWAAFNNILICFFTCVSLFALTALALSFTELNSDMVLIYPAIGSAVLFAAVFTVLTVIYALSAKDAEITDDELIIHFGYHEAGRGGYADFHRKINLSDINSCTVENEHKKLNPFKFFMLVYDSSDYNVSIWEITAGQYSQPFLKLVFDEKILLLPVENAVELCSKINEKICK